MFAYALSCKRLSPPFISYLTRLCSAHFLSLLLQRESDRVSHNVPASAARQKSTAIPSPAPLLWFWTINWENIFLVRLHQRRGVCEGLQQELSRIIFDKCFIHFGKKGFLVFVKQLFNCGWASPVILTSYWYFGLVFCKWWPRKEWLGPHWGQ